jgi:quercetin dioxygenase-like cupin family protein
MSGLGWVATDGLNPPPESRAISTPETVTFGRTLVDCAPIDDGLTVPTDSQTVSLLETTTTTLFSNPRSGAYAAGLVTPDGTDGAYTRGLGIFPPGADGPATHAHPSDDEPFTVVEGEFSIDPDDDSQRLTAGERVPVEAGTPPYVQ